MIENKIYKFFADFVFKKTGIHYPEKDFYRLDSRINTLVNIFSCRSPEDLYNLYQREMTSAMETLLIDLCTNNETYFFRDNKPFDALANDLIPHILTKNPSGTIHIWSCASSTGQEPLSILMTLKDSCPSLKDHQIELYASDISSKALDKAKSGVYTSLDVQRGLPITFLMKYFEQITSDNTWKAKDQILSKIKYDYFNLLTGQYPIQKYDVIFCRNVLIYQDKENKDKIMQNLYGSLKPGGFLLMGAGESMIGSTLDFERETFSNMMVFRKPDYLKKAA